MKKRLLSMALCLCMVLSLLPSVALADGEGAAPATSVIVGGVTLTSSGEGVVAYATTDSSTGEVTPVSDGSTPIDNYVKYENGVLTLKNAKIAGFTKDYDSISTKNVAIYAAGDLELVLEDDNSIVLAASGNNSCYGINTYGSGGTNNANLTIKGDGSLNIPAISSKQNNHCAGISASGTLTIESGNITATGSNTDGNSYGVSATKDFVMTGGSLTATGGDVTGNYTSSVGVTASGTVTISGGTVVATGGTGTISSYGISSGVAGGITINPPEASEVTVTAETKDTDGTHRAFNQAPTIGDAVYNWKTTESGATTLSLTTPYTWDATQTYTALTLGQAVAADKSQLDGVTYAKVNGAWVKDVTSAGLDLTTAPAETTVYKAGTGTVTYVPAAAPANAQLIFDGATMAARDSKMNDTVAAVTLPSAPIDVVFRGENTIGAVNNDTQESSSAVTFSASANTTFTAEAGSKTTLGARGNESKAIYSNGGDITLKGTGELLLAPTVNNSLQKLNGYAIHAPGNTVTIGDGITIYEPRVNTGSTTDTQSGTSGIMAGAVNLNAAAIPEGGTLDLHAIAEAGNVSRGTGALVNNGMLILPEGTSQPSLNAMNITGSGVVGVDGAYYKNVKGTWMTDITNVGLDFTSSAPTEETTYAAGDGFVTYTPGENGGVPTLTLDNAIIAPIAKGDGTPAMPPLALGENAALNIKLIGSSYLKGTGVPALCYYDGNSFKPAGDITIGGSGSLSLVGKDNSGLGSFGAANLTVTDTATVTSPDGTVGAVTVGENAKLNAVLKVNGTRTVYGKNTIAEGVTRFYTDTVLQWAEGSSFEVNGSLTLAKDTVFTDIQDKLSGDGVVRIMKSQEDIGLNPGNAEWDAYLTGGTPLHAYQKLNFSVLPENGGTKRDNTTLEDDGYTFTGNAEGGYVLTLGNLDINCNDSTTAALTLPMDGKVEVKLVGDTRVANTGTAMMFPKDETSQAVYPCTISGSGSLRLTSNGGGAHALDAKQPLTITGGTMRILTTSKTFPAIKASGLTLSGVRIKSPSGATVGSYGTTLSYDTVLAADRKPAASVSIMPVGGSSATSDYTLTFETNGGSAIAKVSKASDTTVDLTAYATTREGYTFAGWYADEALTEKVTSVKLTDNTTVYAKWTEAKGETALPFTDVAEDAYYYDAVKWAVENGVTDGTSATTFAPDDTCTRAQTVTFLWRAMGSPEPTSTTCQFTDVSADAYYYKAVLWAVEKGITKGVTDTAFAPDATVTRGQVVTFLWRAAGGKAVTSANPFTDVAVDSYCADAVLWAVSEKITEGATATTFAPANPCTRGQIVTFLYRFLAK